MHYYLIYILLTLTTVRGWTSWIWPFRKSNFSKIQLSRSVRSPAPTPDFFFNSRPYLVRIDRYHTVRFKTSLPSSVACSAHNLSFFPLSLYEASFLLYKRGAPPTVQPWLLRLQYQGQSRPWTSCSSGWDYHAD